MFYEESFKNINSIRSVILKYSWVYKYSTLNYDEKIVNAIENLENIVRINSELLVENSNCKTLLSGFNTRSLVLDLSYSLEFSFRKPPYFEEAAMV